LTPRRKAPVGFAGSDTGSVPLAAITRGGCVDNLHRGVVVVCDRDGRILYSAGKPDFIACVRSSAKPTQALCAIESGAAQTYGFNDVELALICASHSGKEPQVAGVRSMLAKAGLAESALICGSGVIDNCSGKHTGMLAAIRHLGLSLESYWEPWHPYQQRVLAVFSELAGMNPADVAVAVDGCGAPIFFSPIHMAARVYARLATPDSFPPGPRHEAAAWIVRAMCAHPEMTGESDYHEFLPGRDIVLTKCGGFGYLVAGVIGKGIGAALKIEDGSALPARPVMFEALHRAGAIATADAKALIRGLTPKILNRRGAEVGEFKLLF